MGCHLLREPTTSGVLVLSAEGIKFESYLSVKEFMQSSEQFNENDVENIQKLCDENGKRRRKSETVWKPCETLPEGWKIMVTKTQKHFLTPDGIRIVGRRAAGWRRSGNTTKNYIGIIEFQGM